MDAINVCHAHTELADETECDRSLFRLDDTENRVESFFQLDKDKPLLKIAVNICAIVKIDDDDDDDDDRSHNGKNVRKSVFLIDLFSQSHYETDFQSMCAGCLCVLKLLTNNDHSFDFIARSHSGIVCLSPPQYQ